MRLRLGEFVGDKTEENIIVKNQCNDEIIMGFGIGIPTLSDQETKYARYILNKIAIQQILDGDIDEWDSVEERSGRLMELQKKFDKGAESHTYQRIDAGYHTNIFWDITMMVKCLW